MKGQNRRLRLNLAVIDECRMLLNGIIANIATIAGIEKATKEWFVTAPVRAFLTDGQVGPTWQEKVPNLDTILEKTAVFASTNHSTHWLL